MFFFPPHTLLFSQAGPGNGTLPNGTSTLPPLNETGAELMNSSSAFSVVGEGGEFNVTAPAGGREVDSDTKEL